jgi:hypothetical protein
MALPGGFSGLSMPKPISGFDRRQIGGLPWPSESEPGRAARDASDVRGGGIRRPVTASGAAAQSDRVLWLYAARAAVPAARSGLAGRWPLGGAHSS